MPYEATTPEAGRAVRPPLVSVIIPAYNVAGYIGVALESVFAQTFTDYEVIVVNDGSPDTPALERALAPYGGCLVYVEQENRGPSGARNTAIGRARGEYVALLDGDDQWLPEYLAEQVRMLEADPRLDMVYADAELFGDSPLAGKTFMESAPSRGPVTFESLLRYQTSVITSGTVARKQALVEAGLFDETFVRCEDFDLWLRLAHRGGRISYQRRVLARHRAHAESLAADAIRMVEAQVEVLKKALRHLPLTDVQRELVGRQLSNCAAQIDLERGKRHFAAGEYEQAAAALRRANDFYRRRKLWLVLRALHTAPQVLRFVAHARQKFSGRTTSGAR